MIFNTMTMKRSREEADRRGEDMTTMANYLMLLSGATVSAAAGHHHDDEYSRVFTCKTCNRQFSSFQALGGHRASHKKPRLLAGGAGDGALPQPASPPKPKTHECSVCGLEFPIGQALGGHMRRHRAAATTAADEDRKQAETALSLSTGPPPAAIVKKAANNSRRVLCMDLNLTPLENKFVFGKIAPAAVDCFF